MSHTSSNASVRTAISAGIVAVLVHLAESRDALLDFTRPVVIALLHALGIAASDRGDSIAVGTLSIPWTRDCAGVNLLLILLALGVWMNRSERTSLNYWFRMAALVPAALLANVARVLTLVAYRHAFYPGVENPQLHYFMGLVWLVPVLVWLTPRGQRPREWTTAESLHAAATVALLAPMGGTPHGDVVTIATIIVLAHCRVNEERMSLRRWLMLPWFASGIAIGLLGMESLWLPWLLACPALLNVGWLLNPVAWIVIASTNPIIHFTPMITWASYAAMAWMVWLSWNSQQVNANTPTDPNRWARAQMLVVALLFSVPFLASTLLASRLTRWSPPPGVESRSINAEGFQLLLPGQPGHLALFAYGPTTSDRHHTLKVCLKYRGIELTEVEGEPNVSTDGTHWLREFFLRQDELINDYPTYLMRTFSPGSSPGVHLIFVSDKAQIAARPFHDECQRVAAQLHVLCTTASQPSIARVP